MVHLINGKEISDEIRASIKQANQRDGLQPCLAIVNVGDDKENLIYIGLKENAVKATDGKTRIVSLAATCMKEELLEQIEVLNQDREIDGILLQLPLPDQLKAFQQEFLSAIAPAKDVDGFNPLNLGRLMGGYGSFVSCAALACMEVCQKFAQPLIGKRVLLVGDSFDLIKPLALMFMQESCQVLIVPHYQAGLMEGIDIAIIEKGAAQIVKAAGIKPGALIIDAGFYYDHNHLYGNVDKGALAAVNGHLLPVPGGMGPILISKLLENLGLAARQFKNS